MTGSGGPVDGTWEVQEADGVVLVQDAGRPGHAHLGVPRSGWLDPAAARAALRLVGDPDDAALLEVALGGLALRATDDRWVALTGTARDVRVDGRAAAYGRAVRVPAGAVLSLGPPRAGVRSWLAIGGGVTVPPVLGSRSTDTLSGLGPARLRTGDLLPLGEPAAPGVEEPPYVVGGAARAGGAGHGAPVELRVDPGPRLDRLALEAWARLTTTVWTAAAGDRVGVRLDGPALEHAETSELASEGLVLGAVQVPPDGRPLVFLADHPTTGGYPVAAVVRAADLGGCAQLRPGDPVRFVAGR
ncbi:MAG: allophanate hydrolase [Nocardioides sp.]|nr:allophanate hydrolase [Nocardioides sp.]